MAEKGNTITDTNPQAQVDDEVPEESSSKRFKFRNYQPRDNQFAAAPSKKKAVTTVEDENDNEIEQQDAKKLEQMDVIEAELAAVTSEEINIVPQKVNFDLKQQFAPKLEKLKRRTQKAIVEILRQKLAADSID